MSPLTGLVPSPVWYWVCGGGGGSEYMKETVSWMLFYPFGDVNCAVKGAVLARETVVSYCFHGLPAYKYWILVPHACFTSSK